MFVRILGYFKIYLEYLVFISKVFKDSFLIIFLYNPNCILIYRDFLSYIIQSNSVGWMTKNDNVLYPCFHLGQHFFSIKCISKLCSFFHLTSVQFFIIGNFFTLIKNKLDVSSSSQLILSPIVKTKKIFLTAIEYDHDQNAAPSLMIPLFLDSLTAIMNMFANHLLCKIIKINCWSIKNRCWIFFLVLGWLDI